MDVQKQKQKDKERIGEHRMGRTRIILSSERIKSIAKTYKVSQEKVRKLLKQFQYSSEFELALSKYMDERLS